MCTKMSRVSRIVLMKCTCTIDLVRKHIILLLLQSLLTVTTLGKTCESIVCSNVFDYVCGVAESWDGTRVIVRYQNICHLRQLQCRMRHTLEIHQVSDVLCNIKKDQNAETGRRLNDFSIVGAHQACNHTCPTYCIDTYEPTCAQIWKPNMKSYDYRPMINHCHIDLFSCAVGVNVTIHPLSNCYKNFAGILFMSQVAAMKSLKLLNDIPSGSIPPGNLAHPKQSRRSFRSNNLNKPAIFLRIINKILKNISAKN